MELETIISEINNNVNENIIKIKTECKNIDENNLMIFKNINDVRSYKLFFELVINFPKINKTINHEQLCDIIFLINYYSWEKKNSYYEKLNKIDPSKKFQFYVIVLKTFRLLNIDTTTLLKKNICNMLISEKISCDIGKLISDTYYDNYNFPIYYKLNNLIKLKILDEIRKVTCINLNMLDNNIIISGGLLLGLFNNELYSDSDLDIWTLCNTSPEIIINYDDIDYDVYSACYTNFCYFYLNNKNAKIKKVQIMMFGYKNGFSVINNFDISINKIFISRHGLFIVSKSYNEIINKIIDCSCYNETTPIKIILRLSKYQHRGYKLINNKLNIPKYFEQNYSDFDSFKKSINYIPLNKWKKNNYCHDNEILKSENCNYLGLNYICTGNYYPTHITLSETDKTLLLKKYKNISKNIYENRTVLKISSLNNGTINFNTVPKCIFIFSYNDLFTKEISEMFYYLNFNISKKINDKYLTTFELVPENITINGENINTNKLKINELNNCYIIIKYLSYNDLLRINLYCIDLTITCENILLLD